MTSVTKDGGLETPASQVSQPYPECCLRHRTNGPRGSSCGTLPYEGVDATAETLTREEAVGALCKVGYSPEDAYYMLEPDTARRRSNRSSIESATPILRAYVRGLESRRRQAEDALVSGGYYHSDNASTILDNARTEMFENPDKNVRFILRAYALGLDASLSDATTEIRWAIEQLRPYGARDRVDFGGVGQAIRSLLAAVDAAKTERAFVGRTGYVVRQKLDMTIDGFTYVYPAKHGVTLCREQATVFASANEALDAIREVGPDIRVFAIAADGADVPLPSYEDALEGMALLESAEDAIPEEYSGFSRTQDAIVAMWSEIERLRASQKKGGA